MRGELAAVLASAGALSRERSIWDAFDGFELATLATTSLAPGEGPAEWEAPCADWDAVLP